MREQIVKFCSWKLKFEIAWTWDSICIDRTGGSVPGNVFTLNVMPVWVDKLKFYWSKAWVDIKKIHLEHFKWYICASETVRQKSSRKAKTPRPHSSKSGFLGISAHLHMRLIFLKRFSSCGDVHRLSLPCFRYARPVFSKCYLIPGTTCGWRKTQMVYIW